MTLTVLTDDQIRSLLENLTPDELEGFRSALTSALHEHWASAHDDNNPHLRHQPTLHHHHHHHHHHNHPSPAKPKPTIRPTGAITLLSPTGTPLGLLHAATLTAFRTALGSLSVVRQRTAPLARIVVFGCGEQAYWHVRLALLARGREVREVVFVNRRVSPASEEVLRRFGDGDGEEAVAAVKRREGWEGCRFEVLVRKDADGGEGRLAGVLRGADLVVCCTPSMEPLFDAGVFEGVEKGRLVVAIGSYTPEMREIPAGLVRQALTAGEREAGVVVVDTIEGALTEAGELIEVGVKPEQMVELGELAALEGDDGKDTKRHNLVKWLQTGNVIYKSVGTPASLSFLLFPQSQLPGASAEARLILRNLGGLLLATNLACLALLGGGRVVDDGGADGGVTTALFCAGLGTYHVWPTYRAWVRMGSGQGKGVLGGRWCILWCMWCVWLRWWGVGWLGCWRGDGWYGGDD
ncbi:hypothetical protein B0I37DRAFT_448228 [Chaetomium sp. MPI-CAGE-AT-0009]|nr:hypothetical protein B0I37DRAFT_448228 [Chaetomium sp. MPI-CAGE-AT-0009]